VTEQPPKPTSEDPGSMRSPIRPSRPESDFPEKMPLMSAPATETESQMKTPLPKNPSDALEALRLKMEIAASEFSQGKMNRAQFNAVYARYSEQRSIIERLIQRDPGGQAWKAVAAPGHTRFLMDHFEAHTLYYIVFLHNRPKPL
jgi:hypothetical protein